MKRKLSDKLTNELGFLSKKQINSIGEQLGIIRYIEQLDWFDSIKFLSSEYKDNELEDLIKQYQKNIEIPKKTEEKRQQILDQIHSYYKKEQPINVLKLIKRKRGRPKKKDENDLFTK